MDEFEGAEQIGRDGDLALVLGAALQGPDPDRGGLEVDVHRPDGPGFGDPGAGVREGEGLVLGLLRGALTIPASLFLHSGEVLGYRPGNKSAPVLALPARLGGNGVQERLRKGDLDAPLVPRDHDWHPGAMRQALPLYAIPERRRRHRRWRARAAAMKHLFTDGE